MAPQADSGVYSRDDPCGHHALQKNEPHPRRKGYMSYIDRLCYTETIGRGEQKTGLLISYINTLPGWVVVEKGMVWDRLYSQKMIAFIMPHPVPHHLWQMTPKKCFEQFSCRQRCQFVRRYDNEVVASQVKCGHKHGLLLTDMRKERWLLCWC